MHQIDSRIESSSFKITDWPLCEVRLKNNKQYPWLILIPRTPSLITEIFDLSESERNTLMHEITRSSQIMQNHFLPDKINIGTLGNIVPQLHIHVIARFKNDASWPHSVWQANTPDNAYDTDNLKQLINQLRELLL